MPGPGIGSPALLGGGDDEEASQEAGAGEGDGRKPTDGQTPSS